jgi:hypothetical protein
MRLKMENFFPRAVMSEGLKHSLENHGKAS